MYYINGITYFYIWLYIGVCIHIIFSVRQSAFSPSFIKIEKKIKLTNRLPNNEWLIRFRHKDLLFVFFFSFRKNRFKKNSYFVQKKKDFFKLTLSLSFTYMRIHPRSIEKQIKKARTELRFFSRIQITFLFGWGWNKSVAFVPIRVSPSSSSKSAIAWFQLKIFFFLQDKTIFLKLCEGATLVQKNTHTHMHALTIASLFTTNHGVWSSIGKNEPSLIILTELTDLLSSEESSS